MTYRMGIPVPMDVFMALSEYLDTNYIKDEIGDALGKFVLDWIAQQKAPAVAEETPPPAGGGYQWKQVFLPSGTRLRTMANGKNYYAVVTGDDILYDGRRVSPSIFANAVASTTRSAWRTLWLQFPDSTQWRRASDCRRDAGCT
jgi:hypothetical protein